VAEAELANDVDWVEPNRPKAMFTGLYTFRKDDQALLIKYAEEELTDRQKSTIRQSLVVVNGNHRFSSDSVISTEHGVTIGHAMDNIARDYLVDYLTAFHEKHGEDWLYENYGVYEPEEV